MNRTALRVVTAAVALMLGATAPGATGIAAADDRPADLRTWGLSAALQQDEALVADLKAARDAYRASALSARTAFRTALEGLQLQVQEATATQRADARTAGDAYRAVLEGTATGDLAELKDAFAIAWNAYRDALLAARAAAQPAIDTATGSAKATLMTARSIYTKAVTTAFAEHAPGTPVPRLLQEPSSWMGMSDSRWLGQGSDAERARAPRS
jgi:hypothetical protein